MGGKVSKMNDMCQRNVKALQQTKLIIKYREETIKRLEKARKEKTDITVDDKDSIIVSTCILIFFRIAIWRKKCADFFGSWLIFSDAHVKKNAPESWKLVYDIGLGVLVCIMYCYIFALLLLFQENLEKELKTVKDTHKIEVLNLEMQADKFRKELQQYQRKDTETASAAVLADYQKLQELNSLFKELLAEKEKG